MTFQTGTLFNTENLIALETQKGFVCTVEAAMFTGDYKISIQTNDKIYSLSLISTNNIGHVAHCVCIEYKKSGRHSYGEKSCKKALLTLTNLIKSL